MTKARLTLTALLASATFAVSSVVAHADPDAVEQARRDLERIQEEASAIDQQIIEANDRVAQAEVKLAELQVDLEQQEQRVALTSSEIGDIATFQMQNQSVNLAAGLLTSTDSERFLSGLGVIASETDRSNARIQQLQLDEAKLATLKQDAVSTEEQLKQDRDSKLALAQEYDAKEAEAQAVYNRLSEEERQRLAALEAERIRQAEAAAAATTTAAGATDTAAAASAPVADVAGSDRAVQAVNIAMAQVGKPYGWGKTGPDSFDCSGLMLYAYKQVGISLPRVASAQAGAGRAVSRSELAPGDLVFFYSPISHVAMYIGDGKIVHASNSRTGVIVASLSSNRQYAGARRIVG